MTIHQIEAFITLAEVLNYTRAAQLLHTTQPNLSKLIVNLEEELGVKLFSRSRRDVNLTPAGRAFCTDSRAMLRECDRAVERARRIDRGVEGVVHVGFLGTAMSGRLPAIVNGFRGGNPKITLKLEDYTFTRLESALRSEKIDVALTLDRGLDLIPHVEKQFMFADDMCLVMHCGHPLASRESVDIAEIAEEPFVLMDPKVSPMDFELISEMCAAGGFTPNAVHYANTLQSVALITECGVGVSILAGHMRRFAARDLRFVPINGFENYFRMVCAWRRGANPGADKLVEEIAALAEISGK